MLRDAFKTEYPLPKESTLRKFSFQMTKQKSAQNDVCKVSRDTDITFRRELWFVQIVNWFDPAPVLSAMMLPGWVWGFLVSTFVQGTGWLMRCKRVWLGAKNNELLHPGKALHKFKTKVACQFHFVKTPKNRVSYAFPSE